MPELIKLYVKSVGIGFALSGLFVALLLWQNVGNLGHLVLQTPDGPLAGALLFIFNGLVFSGAQTAVAVLLMTDTNDPHGGPGGNAPELIPVRVEDHPRRGR